MARIEKFEDIEAWKTARELANFVYECSEAGLFSKDFGLRDQMRRAAVSIMSNIAEGFENQSPTIIARIFNQLSAAIPELPALSSLYSLSLLIVSQGIRLRGLRSYALISHEFL